MYRCAYCDTHIDLTVDHIQPESLGGETKERNLQTLCRSCNSSKGFVVSIKRAPRPDGNFYVLDKRISEDDRLSWAARGLLIFLLGKPDHWEVSVQHLVIQTADAIGKSSKRDAVYSILKELSQAGYLVRQRGRGESGEFGKVDYIVTETPVEGDPLTDNPDVVDSPYTDNPDTDKPDTANPTLVSTEGLVTTEAPVSNENNPIGPSPSDDAPAEVSTDDAFEVFWHAGMRKANKKKRAPLSVSRSRPPDRSARPRHLPKRWPLT